MTTANPTPLQRTYWACHREGCGNGTNTYEGVCATVPTEGGLVDYWFCSRGCRTVWLRENGHADLVKQWEGDGDD